MEQVGIREIRQNLSVYLRRVRLGEAFTVTDHGIPVALLTPPAPSDDPLADLVAAGHVIAAPNVGGALPGRRSRGRRPSPTRLLLDERRTDER